MPTTKSSFLAACFLLITQICIAGPFTNNQTDTILELAKHVEGFMDSGKYAEALPLAEKWLTNSEVSNNPAYASTINDIAGLFEYNGNYLKADQLFNESLALYKKTNGSNNSYTAASLNNLAGLSYKMGDYPNAEILFKRSLSLCTNLFGPTNLHTASVLNSMAALYTDEGDYAKAKECCLQGLEMRKQLLGMEDPAIATSLNNLAGITSSVGDYSNAEVAYKQSLAIREKALGTNHPDTLLSWNNLAQLYDDMGDYSKAETIFERILNTTKSTLGTNNPDTASVMDNYAKILRHEGKYNQAEQLYQQSLELRERTLSADHSDIAASLNNLAILNLAEGHYSKAETDFRKSIHIMENDFGAAYPGMADYYHGYGFLMVAMGQTNEALSVGKKEKQAQETAFGTILSFASEMQRMEYQRTRQPYDLLATLGDANDLADEIMHTKGIVLDSLLEDAMTARESRNPEVNNTLKELNQYGRRLNELEIGLPQISDHKESLMLKDFRHELELQIENLQGRLSHEVTTFGRVRRALRITLPQVQSELTTDTMLVEFLRYNYYLGKTDFEPRYGAILIDHTNGPVWVSIGRACDIEHNLKDGEEMMRSRDRGNIAILKTLYSQLMKPVLELLPTNVTTLIISPDAELNFLSFATLVSPQDNFLAEQYRIKYVASGRDLVYGRTTTNINPELAVFADPDFNKSPDSPHLTNTNTVKLAMLSTDTRDYNGYSLLALPYTAQEAEFLRSCCPSWHLKAAIYTGIEAAETQVKALHSPFILHLATHGFFLPDTESTNESANPGFDHKPYVILHNPMQRSGLALAGAELTLEAWKRGEVPDTENDGILMADEVALLDLQNTWLVTLSACDTGIGEARAGEGVLGLRRGFIQAGAQNLLMTLWPVSDKWTVDLMKSFYEKAMKTGNAPDALADVQREYLVKLKKEKGLVIAARLAGPFVMNFQGKP